MVGHEVRVSDGTTGDSEPKNHTFTLTVGRLSDDMVRRRLCIIHGLYTKNLSNVLVY